jgi:LL-diaminopimelate aminotransferase
MSNDSIQNLFAERIGGRNYGKSTAIYKFEKIKRAKKAAQEAHPGAELLDLGVGEPDEMAFSEVVKIMRAETAKSENRGYADNGGPELKAAAARYLDRMCGVKVDSKTQVIHSIGNKAALTLLPACFINPGDITLMTSPGYPVFGTHARYYGGEVHAMKLTEQNEFLPDLGAVPRDILKRAKVMVLNYPNNPTGASATPDFFLEVVNFAKKNKLIVIHDFAYAALVYEGKPLSFLSTPGAMDLAVELHSCSKNFNMTGWRCGFVTGNEKIVRAYGDVKDNSDSGQFLAIQKAAAYAFDHPEITAKITAKYSRRMDLLVPALQKLGFNARKPKGSFFIYARAPKTAVMSGKKIDFPDAESFSQWLITEKLISTVPWDDAGACLRFSVTFSAPTEAEEQKVAKEVIKRLSDTQLVF